MTDKQKMSKSKFRKIAIITGAALIILAVIIRIGFMVAAGNSTPESGQAKASIIQVEGLTDDAITTTDADYRLGFTVQKPTNKTVKQTVKVFLNDKVRQTSSDNKDADLVRYSVLGFSLSSGENSVKITVGENEVGEPAKEVAAKYFKVNLESSKKPTIKIVGATETDGSWLVKNVKKDSYESSVDTVPENSKNSGATSLTVNGRSLSSDDKRGHFSYRAAGLKEGNNVFTFKAKNNIGEITSKVVINRVIPKEDPADPVFEAGITCQEYAERYFGVKDINVHYNSSSIKRKNADGTIIVKADIADSKGFLQPEQPLGIMECTTNSTGMTVLSFDAY